MVLLSFLTQTNLKLITSSKEVMFSSLFVCVSVWLLAALHKSFRTDLHEIFREDEDWQWSNEQMIKFWYSDPDHRLDTEIVFRIRHYWEIWKVVSTDCVTRLCSAQHALAGITIASMTSLRHRPLVEVCTIPALLVLILLITQNELFHCHFYFYPWETWQ